MDRCDFSSIMAILRSYIRENNQLNQSEFLYEVFDDFLSSPEGADFSFDNGLVCRWMSGQAKVSPKLINYYSAKSSQIKLSDTLEQMILPMMFDPDKALSDVYLLFIQDPSISDKKKEQLSSLYLSADTQTLFLSQIICFGMERTFIKRDTKNQKLLAGGSLSPVVLGYIADSEVPRPCRHFIGRESEIENLHECLEINSKVFLYGIPGIGKSELSKAYARKYKKYYTNILYSLQQICLIHGIEVDYYKKLFQTIENIVELIKKDDLPKYLLFLENAFPYMQKYDYQKGMKALLQELKCLLKSKDIGTDSDRALLLDFQATLETQPEKAMKLEKDALALIKEITKENAHLASNLHSNLGGLYRMNGYPDLAREHMEKGLFLLEQYNLLYTNDSIPQITNYAMLLTEQQSPEKGISVLQKLSKVIKKYNSDCNLDYATVQETLGSIYLMTANLPQAKIHFKRAFKIYEKIWVDEPEMIEKKYQEIQELYPQIGVALAQTLRGLTNKHL